MAHLRYIDDAGQFRIKVLDSEHFVVGRADTCELPLESEMMSREHLRIDLEADGRYKIHDLGSRNKTYVNGELVRETLLTSGSIIRAGDRIMEFLEDGLAPEVESLDFLTPDRSDPPDCDWIKIKAPLSLTTQQVERLSQIVGEQPLTARAEDIADIALGQLLLDLQAERGFIAVRGEKKAELRPIASRGLIRAPSDALTPVSQSFAFAPVLQKVAGRYPQSAGKIDAKLGYATVGLVAPLTCRGEISGVVYVDRPVAKKPFPTASVQYLAGAGAMLGAMLTESARKIAGFARREGATWMATIRQLQKALTDKMPASETFDRAVHLFPGRLRCGDFATFIPLDDQRCAAVMIDGGGHGVSGIAQSSAIRMAVQAAIAVSDDALGDPAVIFNALNVRIGSSGARQVLPCTFVGIDMASGKLSYVNAGGLPPLVMTAPGRLVTLDQVSLVLGIDADYIYETTRVDLPEAFRLVCCTDGVIEATSAAGDAFGDQRLHEALLDRQAFGSAADVVSAVTSARQTHMASAQAEDDALVLVVARG